MPEISGNRGAEKLRHQEGFAKELTVYVMTNRFKSVRWSLRRKMLLNFLVKA